jgi:thiol:disulfide interchange protein
MLMKEAIHSQLERSGFPPGEMLDEREIQQKEEGNKEAAEERQEETNTQPVWFWILSLGVVIFATAGYLGYILYPRFGLPAVEGASLLLLATGAGIASFFSPCSYPLLVTLLARQPGVAGGKGSGKEPEPSGNQFSFAAVLSIGAALFLILGGLVISLGG